MKPYLTLVAGTLLLALAGCNKETGPAGLSGDRPIAFDAAATGTQTRAAGEVSVDAALQARSFGVFASYTGKLSYENTTVSPDYMYNQEVKYNATAQVWEYTPVKYWPNNPDDYLSFFAYSPYEANPGEGSASGIIGMSRDVDLGDPWINFRLPEYANQVDLLYAAPWMDQHRHNEGEPAMQFTFHHALACIGEVVTVKMSDALYANMHGDVDITIDKVTIQYNNLTTKARLVLHSIGAPNWKEIISGELTCSRSYDSGTLTGKTFSKDAASNPDALTLSSGEGLFYIPLRVKGTALPEAVITLTYTVSNDNGTFTSLAAATVTFVPGDPGTKQGLALTLNGDMNLEATVITDATGIGMPGTISPTGTEVTVMAPIGAIDGLFSVSASQKVYFSKGNLQATGTTASSPSSGWTWAFAEHQYDCVGIGNGGQYPLTANNTMNGDGTISSDGTVDLFGWSSVGGPYYGIYKLEQAGPYTAVFYDWANTIGEGWRTPSHSELQYLLLQRKTATVAGTANARYTMATVNTDGTPVRGLIIFPDNYSGDTPTGVTWGTINSNCDYTTQCTAAGWTFLESLGCVFLPAAGYYDGSSYGGNLTGNYWTCERHPSYDLLPYVLFFREDIPNPIDNQAFFPYTHAAVRLVKDE